MPRGARLADYAYANPPYDSRPFHLFPLEILQYLPRRVVPGGAGDAAAGVGAGAAHIEAGDRAAMVGVAQHRAGREYLVEVERAVEDVAADQAESPLQVQRAHDLAA